MNSLSNEMTFTKQTRAFCDQCDFLKSRCLCDTIQSVHNQTQLVILQHPSETKHPLNTVRIMSKSFKNILIFKGEDFNQHQLLNEILANPENNVLLLYPGPQSQTLSQDNIQQKNQKPISHLIVIDGTWRKAKKIFLTSQNLQMLETCKLSQISSTEYKIRKAPTPDSLSTLEATVEALAIIEPQLDTSHALKSFHKMIDLQIQKMGREVYLNNYLSKKKE